jgi:hypothetical protein
MYQKMKGHPMKVEKLVPVKCRACGYPYRTRRPETNTECQACQAEDAVRAAERRWAAARRKAVELRRQQARRAGKIKRGEIKLREVVIRKHVGWHEPEADYKVFEINRGRYVLLCGAKGHPAVQLYDVDSRADLPDLSPDTIDDAIKRTNCAKCQRKLRALEAA